MEIRYPHIVFVLRAGEWNGFEKQFHPLSGEGTDVLYVHYCILHKEERYRVWKVETRKKSAYGIRMCARGNNTDITAVMPYNSVHFQPEELDVPNLTQEEAFEAIQNDIALATLNDFADTDLNELLNDTDARAAGLASNTGAAALHPVGDAMASSMGSLQKAKRRRDLVEEDSLRRTTDDTPPSNAVALGSLQKARRLSEPVEEDLQRRDTPPLASKTGAAALHPVSAQEAMASALWKVQEARRLRNEAEADLLRRGA